MLISCNVFLGIAIVSAKTPSFLTLSQMPLANRCQKHNAQAHHHLVCEQNLFLRTLCLSDFTGKEDRKQRKLHKMLCESAANLAETVSRLEQVNLVCKVVWPPQGAVTLKDPIFVVGKNALFK